MKKTSITELLRVVGFAVALKIIAVLIVLLITEYGVGREENEKFVLSEETQVNT